MIDDVLGGMELPDEIEEDSTVAFFKNALIFFAVFGAAYWFGLFARH
tara:strand:- start:69 stop:209 length:141 start_codon:yes stop_codon:yes gene_type:complete